MNWKELKAEWTKFEGRARRKWGKLTDDDWEVVKGDREILKGKIQERYGREQEQAEEELNEWVESL